MGIAELVRVTWVGFAKRLGPKTSPFVEAVGLGGVPLSANVHLAPGVQSAPPKGSRGVFLPLGHGRREGVVIALHNYETYIPLTEGEVAIYSTTADGKTVKAQILLEADGKIRIANTSQSLKTQLDSLLTALSTFAAACTASTTDPTLVAAATALQTSVATVKSSVALLLKD